MSDQVDQLRAFATRGLAAQRAVDQVLARHEVRERSTIRTDDLPPWKHCDVEGCDRWTRGAFCP